jgi:hypothetical protein
MRIPHTRLICALTVATMGLGPVAVRAGQGPGRPPKRVAPALDAVLPLLNDAVVRIKAGDTALTGIRVKPDVALVTLPGDAPPPAGYEAALYDAWTAAPVVATDAATRTVLVRVPAPRNPAPALKPATLPPSAGFVIGAASKGQTLDIRTVWVEPGEAVGVPPGGAVFAVDGGFLGVMNGKALVSGAEILARANRLAK